MPARWHLQTPFSVRRRLRPALRQSAASRARDGAHNNKMLVEPQLILELLLLGVATGFLAGLLGIGGGMIMVPFISIILTAKG